MFTFRVNSDTMKVIGLINPCHRPNQKPAGSGPVSTSSFGPAAHAANSSAVPASSKPHFAPDLINKRPSQSFVFPDCAALRASDERRMKHLGGPFGPHSHRVTSPELNQ